MRDQTSNPPSSQFSRAAQYLRMSTGFRCPRCGGTKSCPKSDGLVRCADCDYQVSVTAGTVFQDSRLPLTLWFRAFDPQDGMRRE